MAFFPRYFLCAMLTSAAAFGQLFSAGIKVGVPLTDAFSNETFTVPNSTTVVQSLSDSKKFVAGPMVELHLPFGFFVEADGLYRPLRLTMIFNPNTPDPGKNSANYASWEVSALAKYRFLHTPIVKPYAEAGPAFRFLDAPLDHSLSTHGFTLGAGIEIKLLRFRISPELRYTRWGSDFNVPPLFPFQSDQNQGEFLVGFTF